MKTKMQTQVWLPALLLAAVTLGGWQCSDAETPPAPAGPRSVQFQSEGVPIAGTLHLPAGFSEDQKYTGVVVTGSWFTVKEQMPDLYARRLAEMGYVALTFDFRYFGESGGAPRFYEMPADKVRDITHAVDYLRSLPFIDRDKIAGLGICISAGMVAAASIGNDHIKALALVAPGLQQRSTFVRAFGSEAGLQAKIDEGEAARLHYQHTGEARYIPLISSTDRSAAIVVPDNTDYYLDPARGAIPEWTNRFAVMSWGPILAFNSVSIGRDIRVPTLVVHSETAANPGEVREFYDLISGAPKQIEWMNGTQYDFYDQDPTVSAALNRVDLFFRELF